ncbi:MAG: type I methionyl aminopeptidase [Oscillospiraceae bacterium]|nr:type I methionyl aminopeptidase [Oscillospiraceae bacterium]
MITLRSGADIDRLREAGRLTAEVRTLAGSLVRPGVTTKAIDREIRSFIKSHGAKASFLDEGFPGAACISVNDIVIHGIPGSRMLHEGDIVSIDVGAYLNGFHGDCAATFPVGTVLPEHQALIDGTRESFFKALEVMRSGYRVRDIGNAVQSYAESLGYGVVKDYCGHGVGRRLHEDPEIPNYVDNSPREIQKGRVRLVAGMVIAVEPMVTLGSSETFVDKDKWTVRTKDGKYSAHYENTVLITSGEPEILTR